MKANTKVTKATYETVMNRDKSCKLCGSTYWLVLHHLLYKSLGGSSNERNLIVLCTQCHTSKVHPNGKHYFNILLDIQRMNYENLTKHDLKIKNKWEVVK